MGYESIIEIASLCYRKGIADVVICPGSRCAPLTLAFTRQTGLTVRTFNDERSAGFVALGIAQQTRKPVALLCTSGTAAYNFAPAVAEAFFNQVPLLVFTADRPREWIGQQDGQTIYQSDIYGRHVKQSLELPQEYEHEDDWWAIGKTINVAINSAMEEPAGPVHINAPFREPLYFGPNETTPGVRTLPLVNTVSARHELPADARNELTARWGEFHNILVVAGQHANDPSLVSRVERFAGFRSVPLVSDVVGNLHGAPNAILHADAFLGQASHDLKKSLQPDLLVTFGRSVVSKNLKQFLRQWPAKEHWHIQPSGAVADTFQHLTKVVRTSPNHFLDLIATNENRESFEGQKQLNYYKFWEIEERRTVSSIEEFFTRDELGEFELVYHVLKALPSNCNLHLANSLSVRYANSIGLRQNLADVSVFANRGTSGIDGCTSTTVGHALSNQKLNFLITGDVAFFYDRNAFWHNYGLTNLRIVLLNNHGGAIFKIIDTGKDLPESDEFFVTHQKLNARKTCEEFGFEHILLDGRRKLNNALKNFMDPEPVVKILEIETSTGEVSATMEQFKLHLKKRYEL